jgi:uncharacterized membrane protein
MMAIPWTHSGPAVLAAFLASLVEFVEALTIVLAVGVTRGWRSAITGALGGIAFLTVLVVAFGPSLGRVPISSLQLIVGVLLLLFGMRWLRKAILRAAGALALHDEQKIFARETNNLRLNSGGSATLSLDGIGLITSFKAVVIEGLEVVFIVIAVGATGNMLLPASIGAFAAGLLVIVLGLLLHKPLSLVPENTLKFAVGILLSSFGTFWIGEGLHFAWFGQDWAIVGLVLGFLLASFLSIGLVKRQLRPVGVEA